MDEDQKRPARRFRITRKVKEPSVRTDAERAMAELEAEEEADPGSPEMNREVRQGCGGCLNVTILMIVIMLASILTTCYMNKK